MNNQAKVLSIDYIASSTSRSMHLPIDVFKRPRNESEYLRLQTILDQLIDEVKEDENHPLVTAMEIIGENLEQYDDEVHPVIGEGISEIEMVKYLMKEKGFYQKDLADIFGGQANVSKFLNGERALSKSNIVGLKKKFGLSADFFMRLSE